jgi:tRNA-uridine 2-sulfurtransferase
MKLSFCSFNEKDKKSINNTIIHVFISTTITYTKSCNMFKNGLRACLQISYITKTLYSTKNEQYLQTGLDYLKLCLNRSIQTHGDLYDKTNVHYHDYMLLKLCQHNKLDLNKLYAKDPSLFEVLHDYKLPKKIYVGLSSGIDSTFSAALLSQVYPGEVHGIYMQNWGKQQDFSVRDGQKCYERDIKELQALLKKPNALEVRDFHVKSFEREYWFSVFEPFLEEYKKGETPNPDISCNSMIKFNALLRYIDEVLEKDSPNKDYMLVMGHYCKRMNERGIFIADDVGKDQSYYLSQVDSDIFKRVWFPLGHIKKRECREFSKMFDLSNFKKKDSVGICFIENERIENKEVISRTRIFTQFLSDYLHENEGHFISHLKREDIYQNENDIKKALKTYVLKCEESERSHDLVKVYWRVKHKGLHTYTLGQRVKEPLPQTKKLAGKWYVSKKNIGKNELEVVCGSDNVDLYNQVIHFKDIVMQDEKRLYSSEKLGIKFRSLHLSVEDNEKQLIEIDSLNENNSVTLKHKQKGINPGQYLVVFDFHTGQVLMSSKIR